MADVNLTQSSAQVKAFLERMSPFIGSGEKMSALGFAYAICSTPGDIAVKEVSVPDFIRAEGAIIAVHFLHAFTVSNPKIKVGSNEPVDMLLYGGALAPGKVRANTIVTMRYSQGYYYVISIESQAGISTQGAVDLALPSGLLWCEHNVGASRPEDAGLFFSWGNITGHADGSGYNFSQSNYNSSLGATLIGNIPVSDQFDMAHHNMGGQWRLPRMAEFQELLNNCSLEWLNQDGVDGIRATSNNNSNSIFFPAAGAYDGTTNDLAGEVGMYWCSDLNTDNSVGTFEADNNGHGSVDWFDERYMGINVRAVM